MQQTIIYKIGVHKKGINVIKKVKLFISFVAFETLHENRYDVWTNKRLLAKAVSSDLCSFNCLLRRISCRKHGKRECQKLYILDKDRLICLMQSIFKVEDYIQALELATDSIILQNSLYSVEADFIKDFILLFVAKEPYPVE